MQEKMPVLKEAQLHRRLADRQEDFDAAVAELELRVKELTETVTQDSKAAIETAVEKVHTAYQKAEAIF
jgi:hypothetical protein